MIFFFQSEKILSVLILLGMMVCDMIFLIFGNIYWSDAKTNEYEIYKNNVVTLRFNSSDIDRFLNMTGDRNYITYTFFKYTEHEGTDQAVIISAYRPSYDPKGQRIRLGHGLTGTGMECMMSDDRYRTLEISGSPWNKDFPWNNGLPENNGFSGNNEKGEETGGKFHFLGADWTCTGVIAPPGMADNFDFLINLSDFQTYVQGVITAGFRYENGTSLVEIQKFANEMKQELLADSVTVPSKTAGIGFKEFLSDMSGMLTLLVIAIINYMFLYRFLLEKRMYTYGIYKLHGMDNRLTLTGLCAEMLIFLIAAFAFSLLLYFGGIALLGQMGTVLQHVREFWFSFIIISVINLFFFGLTTVKLIRSSPVELIRESVVN